MTTVKEILNDAFFEIKVKKEGVPLEASEVQVGIRYLNNLMATWSANGINLGYTVVTKISDPITVALGANQGIIGQLAINLANQFNAEVTPSLALMAKEGYAAILNLSVNTSPRQYPSILPRGSGNYNSSCYEYYPETVQSILGEAGGTVSLEDDTEEA